MMIDRITSAASLLARTPVKPSRKHWTLLEMANILDDSLMYGKIVDMLNEPNPIMQGLSERITCT